MSYLGAKTKDSVDLVLHGSSNHVFKLPVISSQPFGSGTGHFRDCEEDNSGPPELHMDCDSDENYDPSV